METIVVATQFAAVQPRRVNPAQQESEPEASRGLQPIAAVMPAVLARYGLLGVRPTVELPPLAAETCLTP